MTTYSTASDSDSRDVLAYRLSRRSVTRLFLGGGLLLSSASLLAACGDDDDGGQSDPTSAVTEPTSTQEAASPAAAEPTTAAEAAATEPASDINDGGGLVVSIFLEMTSLDPAQQTWIPGGLVLRNVVENLVSVGDDFEILPWLAESWESTPDGLEWTWHLREGVTFQDDTPFNAEAVKFAFDRILRPETKSQSGLAVIGPYEMSEVIDDATVKIVYSEPYAPMLFNVSGTALAMVSPTAVQNSPEDFAQHPVGSGPYVFKEWVRGDKVVLERWDGYVPKNPRAGHDGPPYLDTLTVKFVTEHQTRLASLQNGELDFMFLVPPLDVESMKADSNFQVFEHLFTGAPTMFLINRQLPPTDDLVVAQAIQYAVNKEVITQIRTNGLSPVAWGPLKPTNWTYNPEVESLYSFDPEKANSMLEEAGWTMGPDGIRIKGDQEGKLIINVKDDPLTISMLEAIQGMLQDVGLGLEIVTMSLAASEDLARQGKNSLTFMDWRGIDPDILTVHYHSSNITGWNMGYFDNPELDELLDRGRTTIDPDERFEIYQEAQLLIMREAATLPLLNENQIDAAKVGIEGITYDATKAMPEWYDARWTS